MIEHITVKVSLKVSCTEPTIFLSICRGFRVFPEILQFLLSSSTSCYWDTAGNLKSLLIMCLVDRDKTRVLSRRFVVALVLAASASSLWGRAFHEFSNIWRNIM